MNRIAMFVLFFSPFIAAPSCGDKEPAGGGQEEPAVEEGAAEEHADCPKKKGHGHGSPEERAKEHLAKMDADENGVVTLEEFESHVKEKKFAKMDADGSGEVTLEELEAFKKAKHGKKGCDCKKDCDCGKGHGPKKGKAEEMLSKMDADGSGGVSIEEALSHFKQKKFEKVDADGNGELTLEEVIAYKKAKHGKKGCPGKKGHGHHGSIEEHAKEIFDELDADKSGVLSADEAKGHWMEKKFEKADADGNGELTLEELVAFKKAKHAK